MLEVYCDSSFNEGGPSFIGCFIIKDGVELYQSTTRIIPDPISNLECEMAAISFASSIAMLFSKNDKVTIYNDSTEAVKEFQARKSEGLTFEYVSRDDPYQSVADRLSKKFQQARIETYDLCKRPIEPFTPEILQDIAVSHRPVIYLRKDTRESTNTRTIYRLVIRTVDGIVSDDRTYVAKAGEVKNIKVARDVSKDLSDNAVLSSFKGMSIDNSYFLLTDETWGLRLKGNEAYSILPCSVPHCIICHEVDRTADNLFNRVSPYTNRM
jgi:hypothetical protein